jgi:cellulose synthase/poly-beta-1,6-N-acetylglucosamine synthase-like glycosyltransferase
MSSGQTPMISILVAARNEERSIGSCIDALLAQDYPKDRFEIWIGNDQSQDDTEYIIKEYVKKNRNVHLLNIESPLKHQKGKANVLAQLAHKASGDYLFITDADMTVVPTWISSMLSSFSSGTGVITGVTAVKGNDMFSRLQNAEWVFYTAHGHFNAKKGKPVTAMGNNMAVTTEAYWKVGGYENIPFSVTEDYELFRQIMSKGFGFRTVFSADTLGFTNPLPTFRAVIKQRKRWFTGALQLPKPLIAGLIVLWSYALIIVLAACLGGWKAAALALALKWLLDVIFLLKAYTDLDLKLDNSIWIYTPYSLVCNMIFLIAQLMPGPVEWKGRKY